MHDEGALHMQEMELLEGGKASIMSLDGQAPQKGDEGRIWAVDLRSWSTRTCDDFGALKVLVGVQIARREGKIESHEHQE